MSGEYFDYEEGHIGNISEKLIQLLRLKDYEGVLTEEAIENFFHLLDDPTYDQEAICTLEPETLLKMKKALHYLHIAQIYATRVCYLMSEDDGEDSFNERLTEDLDELKNQTVAHMESIPVSEYWDERCVLSKEKNDFKSIIETTDKTPPPKKEDEGYTGYTG